MPPRLRCASLLIVSALLSSATALGSDDLLARCTRGELEACRALAEAHASGKGAERDLQRADSLLAFACEREDAAACHRLAELRTRALAGHSLCEVGTERPPANTGPVRFSFLYRCERAQKRDAQNLIERACRLGREEACPRGLRPPAPEARRTEANPTTAKPPAEEVVTPGNAAPAPVKQGSLLVTVLEAGKPVRGAQVTLEAHPERIPGEAITKRTDTRGVARFTGPEGKLFAVWARAPGRMGSGGLVAPKAKSAAEATVTLEPTAQLRGRVTGAAETSKVSVSLRDGLGRTLSTVSADEQGRFVLDEVTGGHQSFEVIARSPDGRVGLTDTQTRGPGTVEVTVGLDEGGALLRLVNERGQPLVGAKVLQGNQPLATDSRGEVVVRHAWGHVDRLYFDASHMGAWKRFELPLPKSPAPVTATIPMGRIAMHLAPPSANDTHELTIVRPPDVALGVRDGDEYVFSGLTSGTYSVMLTRGPPGERNRLFTSVTLGPDEQRVLSLSDFAPGATLEGRVVDSVHGLARAGLELRTQCGASTSEGRKDCSTRTLPDGTFRLTNLEPGDHLLEFVGKGFAPMWRLVEARPGTSRLGDLEISPIRAFTLDGSPTPGAEPGLDLRWPGFSSEPSPRGLLVTGTHREDAPVQKGDLILTCNGAPLGNAGALAFLAALELRGPARCEVLRGKKQQSFELPPRPDKGRGPSWWRGGAQ